jgi:hypothetical protein
LKYEKTELKRSKLRGIQPEAENLMNGIVEFVFPRRLHRLAYFLRGSAANIVLSIHYYEISIQGNGHLWSSLIIVWSYTVLFIVLPRIRDVGMKWWWIPFIFFTPLYFVFGIILLFRAPNYHLRESDQIAN